jgi:hypothetical protein
LISGEIWEKYPETDVDWDSIPETAYPEINHAWALTFAGEILQITCVWLIKACLLILYMRAMYAPFNL